MNTDMDNVDNEQNCGSDWPVRCGTGCNHDVRVAVLPCKEDVEAELLKMGASPAGIEIMAEKGVFRTVILRNVPIKAALIIKQEMLAKGGEAALPHSAIGLCADSCDILLMGTLRQYERVIHTLALQPFGLLGIAREIQCALASYDGRPESICIGGRTFLCGERTYIMGILNVTPDSFSDGGAYTTADSAFEHAMEMLEAGADIIDIGGESTKPGVDPLPLGEELERVLPIVKRLASQTDAVISIDTYKAEVAERCLDLGAHIINDVSALRGEGDMASVVSRYNAPVVLMHSKGRPTHMQADPTYECVVREVYSFLAERMEYACERGVSPCNIILDPGIGFGKTPQHNLELMRRLAEFKSLGRPILVGTSRKSTIGKVLHKPVSDRVWGTAATVATAIMSGADIVRVHDVREMAMVAQMTDAICRGWRGEEDGHES
jgi:dihydropteroate synthase